MPDLPADILSRARQIILPLVTSEDDREVLLTEAFYLYDPLLYRIKREGPPKTFSVMCVKTLLDHGCLNNGEHALARLLTVARIDCGVEKQPEIDVLIDLVNGLCGNAKSSTISHSLPTQSVLSLIQNTPLQTLSTPRAERQATVFISYSHRDTEFSERLIVALNAAGHACWIDTSEIKGGDEWIMAIAEGINNSYAFVPIVTRKALESRWVQDEILWARQKNKLIIPVLLEDVFAETRFFPLVSYQGVTFFDKDEAQAIEQLKSYLPALSLTRVDIEGAGTRDKAFDFSHLGLPTPNTTSRSITRMLELDYLERLHLEELLNTDKYTPLSGLSQQKRPVIRAVFELMPMGKERDTSHVTRRFENAVSEIRHLRQAVLLGEPGGGKTTTLWKLAADLAVAAVNDAREPIPLLIRLGRWTEDNQSLEAFIQSQLGPMGEFLGTLLKEKRAGLLLDGLNELPVSQRLNKYSQIRHFINKHSDLLAVVTCRELDYTLDLGLNKITIMPLNPVRIRDFVTNYLGDEKGNDLFWRLAGQHAHEYYDDFIRKVGTIHESDFWLGDSLPKGVSWTYDWDEGNKYGYWDSWLRIREHPSGLMVLARNPYMLLMLTSLYSNLGTLPDNRGQVFSQFVTILLNREHISLDDQEALLRGLAQVAFMMQSNKSGEVGAALTVLPQTVIESILGEQLLYLARSASLLGMGEQTNFTHQLLQEYFAAKYVDFERREGRLRGEDLWPADRWWERNNWEETLILLAGLYSDDPSPIVLWLKDAQPEITAQCVTRSGVAVPPDSTLKQLRDSWLPRLVNTTYEPNVKARAAIGRALGQLCLADHTPLDNRPGVSISTLNKVKLPDIEWVMIEGGAFVYGDKTEDNGPKIVNLAPFEISRYPVTSAQFQTFLQDPDGYNDLSWFEGFAGSKEAYQIKNQFFPYYNHPREMVNWYQAMAFCRWFSWRLEGRKYGLNDIGEWLVRLPTDSEWEKAARGQKGLLYPYGNTFDISKGNTAETGIGQTSSVGIFPSGASIYGVEDMSGNVREWCLTDPAMLGYSVERENLTRDARRVVRGGSWYDYSDLAQAIYCDDLSPKVRDYRFGFRICRRVN